MGLLRTATACFAGDEGVRVAGVSLRSPVQPSSTELQLGECVPGCSWECASSLPAAHTSAQRQGKVRCSRDALRQGGRSAAGHSGGANDGPPVPSSCMRGCVPSVPGLLLVGETPRLGAQGDRRRRRMPAVPEDVYLPEDFTRPRLFACGTARGQRSAVADVEARRSLARVTSMLCARAQVRRMLHAPACEEPPVARPLHD